MKKIGRWFIVCALAGLPARAADFAIRFDGSNDLVTFGTALPLGTTNFTIECWFQRLGTGIVTSTGSGGISAVPLLTKGTGQNEGNITNMNYFLGLRGTDRVVAVDFESTNSSPVGQNFPAFGLTALSETGFWHHAASTYDGTNWSVYLDGLLESVTPATNAANGPGQVPTWNSIQHAALGSALTSVGTPGGFFGGLIDEPRVWNYARTAQEIADTMRLEITNAEAGLLGRWGLNEGGASLTATNSIAGSPNGALSNGAVYAAGYPFEHAGTGGLFFDGTNDYVTFGPTNALGTGTFTIETWFKRTGNGMLASTGSGGITNAVPLVTKGAAEAEGGVVDANYFLGLRITDGRLVADFEEGSGGASPGLNHPVVCPTPAASNVWNHAAATYDGTNWSLYLNGVLETNLFVGQPPQSASIQHAALGTSQRTNGTPQGFFHGVLDEPRIWNHARSPQDIAYYMQARIASAPGLLARWPLDAERGFIASNTAVPAIAGSLSNGATWVAGYPFSTNIAPLAVDDAAFAFEDFAVAVSVGANDVDADGNLDTNSVVVLSAPANGTVTTNAGDSLTYTPAGDFNGTNTFEYRICDLDGLCDTATVTVTVSPVNDAPVAEDSPFGVPEDGVSTFDVVATDVDGNLDTNSVVIITPPANGSVVTNAGDNVAYTPDLNFHGTNTFEFRICDLDGLCDTGLVTMTVSPVNDDPVAADDTVTTNQNESATLDVTGNDTDVENELDTNSVVVISVPADGAVTTNAGGVLTFTPNLNFYGTNFFDYRICDLGGLCDTATVTVIIAPVNTAGPVAVDDSIGTLEDFAVLLNVAANDTDADNNINTNSVVVISPPANGSVITNAGGVLTYTPDGNFNGTNTFDYMICDLGSLCDTATVTIAVTSVPDAPVANDEPIGVGEDDISTFNVLNNDTDVDFDIDTNSVVVIVAPANGIVTTNVGGSLNYDSDPDFFGTNTFDYRVCDLSGLCDTGTVTMTVFSNNDAPVAADDSVTTNEDAAATLNVAANDTDVEGGLDTNSVVAISVPANGSVSTNAGSVLTFTPDPNFDGTNTFEYRICDLDGLCDTGTVEVVILPDFDEDGIPDVTDADDDNDGIPDFWETQYGLNPLDPSDAVVDGDLDTFLNIQEYVADTVPTNAESFHKVVGISHASPTGITFPSSTGRIYGLEYSTDLLLPTWGPVETNVPGQSGSTTITDTNESPIRHYRIGVGLP